MKEENFEAGKETEESFLKIRNLMQIDLMTLFFGYEPNEDQMADWIKNNSKNFGIIISEHPDIATLYTQDKGAALEKMSELLYDKHIAGE